MAYRPNFADARVRRRCIRALGFIQTHLADRPRALSTRYIDRYLGQPQNDLSGYLRKCLLINTKQTWNLHTGQCKEYRANVEGVRWLRSQLGQITPGPDSGTAPPPDIARDHDCVWHFLNSEYQAELRSGLQYRDQSQRLWHDLQNIQNTYKRPWLASQDLCHQYDIECAAPRLLLQRAQDSGLDLYLETLEAYIQDRSLYRHQLSQELGITEGQVKTLINALIAGARLGSGRYFALGRLLEHDTEVIQSVRSHAWIQALRSDIRVMWQYIYEDLGITRIRTRSGQIRQLPLSPGRKWQIYFQEERRCLDQIRAYLDSLGQRYLLEHDGWTCDQALDLEHLSDHIQQTCQRSLRFQYQFIQKP